MRIAGGEFGGRAILVPKTGDIRPTQDSVREALFSMLMNEVPGADFLDLFAGTGAVGLEALSRGAKSVAFVEQNARHLDVLKRNIAAVAPGGSEAAARCRAPVRADAYSFIKKYSGAPFDIAFADPPYALGEERGYAAVLDDLAARGVVRRGGLFIAEATARQEVGEQEGWELVRDRIYGKSRLLIWRRK